MKLPLVSSELIEHLEAAFPNRVPRKHETEREIWMAVGARNVVENLRSMHESAVQKALDQKTGR